MDFGILPFPLIVRTPFFNVKYTPLLFTAALTFDVGTAEKSIVVAKVTAKILFIFLILTPPGIETLIMCFQNTIQNLIYNYMMSYAN